MFLAPGLRPNTLSKMMVLRDLSARVTWTQCLFTSRAAARKNTMLTMAIGKLAELEMMALAAEKLNEKDIQPYMLLPSTVLWELMLKFEHFRSCNSYMSSSSSSSSCFPSLLPWLWFH
jgi:hypothetical protein